MTDHAPNPTAAPFITWHVAEGSPATAAALRAALDARGATPAALANMAGLKVSRVEDLLAGGRPTEIELVTLATALGASLADFPHPLYGGPPIDIRPTVMTFAMAMELKLRAREHRGDWADIDMGKAFRHLATEFGELASALNKGSALDLSDEAVDVANQAMIIWDRTRAPYGGHDRGRAIVDAGGPEAWAVHLADRAVRKAGTL